MMTKVKLAFFLALFFLLPGPCGAQPKLSQGDDWDQKHADEASVELFYSYRVDLAQDGSYTELLHRTTRVQNERGMENEGEITVSYNRKYQVIKKLSVTLRDPDGKSHPPKMIQDADTVTERYYSDIRRKIITMPNVVPGSVIDFEMEVFNKQAAIKGAFFLALELFNLGPFKHQAVTLSAPVGKTLHFKNVNTDVLPVVRRQKNRVTYAWEQKNDDGYDPEISKEKGVPPAIDFLPHVFVSTMKDWASFSRWYQKQFSKNAVVTPEIREAVATITRGQMTLEDKIESLERYLTDNFRYVAISLDAHNFEPHPAAEVFKNKFGDCKDQSVLFVTMLKALGLEAHPVLVRDQSLGDFANLLPDPGCFDHTIVAIKNHDKTYFVDPLVEGTRASELPLHLEGDYALIVDDKDGVALRLPFLDIRQKTNTIRSFIRLKADGSAQNDLALTYDRPESIDRRRELRLQTLLDKKIFLEYLENLTQGGKVVDYKLEGLDDRYGFLTIKVKTENPQLIKPRGPFLIFGETGFDFTSMFPEKERKYPLWIDTETQTVKLSEYTIPDGFTFEYVPPSVRLSSECLDVEVRYTPVKNGIIQEIRQHVKRGLILPKGYVAFKDFLIKAERALDECVIIKAKS